MTRIMRDVYRTVVAQLDTMGYFVGNKNGRKYTRKELKRSGEFNGGLTILKIPENPRKILGVVIDPRLDLIAGIYIADNGDISYNVCGDDDARIENEVESFMNSLEFPDLKPKLTVTKIDGFGNIAKEYTPYTSIMRRLTSPCKLY